MKKSKFPYMVLIPMLLLLTVFVVIPIIASFAISFIGAVPIFAILITKHLPQIATDQTTFVQIAP